MNPKDPKFKRGTRKRESLREHLDHLQQKLAQQAEQIETLAKALERSMDQAEVACYSLEKIQDVLRARNLIPEQMLASQQLLERIQEVVRLHVPQDATVIVVSKGDPELLRIPGGQAWHFPRQADGQYAGYYPGTSLSAIAHLEALRAQGGQYLLFPKPAFWWLDHYSAFRQHLDDSYRLIASLDDSCRLYSLSEAPNRTSASLSAQLRQLFTAFQTRFNRDPAILDWNTGLELGRMFPQFAVFVPPTREGPLPYVDRSVDIVAVRNVDAFALAEAHRVASAAVITSQPESDPEIAWQLGAGEGALLSASIVIPVFNGRALTDACLESLRRTLPAGFQGEIIVVDDCSTDGTARSLQQWRKRDPRIKVVRNNQNLGFVDTCNNGARKAIGDLLIFLNNDLVLLPGWFTPLLDTFRHFPETGVVGGKLILPDGTLQEAGGCVFRDGSAMNFGRCDADLDAPLFNFVREVDYCSAALFATPRALFQKLDGFDTAFRPGYYEDTDYCFRVRAAGKKVLYQPESAALHREGGTAGTDLKQGMKRYQVSNQGTFSQRWAETLKRQPTRPAWSDKVAIQSLAFGTGKRALVVSYYPPEFDRDSGSRRILDLIELLLADGYSVTFLASHRLGDARYVRTLQQMGIQVLLGARTETEKLLGVGQFDLALLAFWPVAEIYLPAIRKASPRTRVIVDSVDLHFLRVGRGKFVSAANEGKIGGLDEAFGNEFVRELNLYAAADAVLTVSQKEADWLNDFIGLKNLSFPLSDFECEPVAPAPLSERRGILFMGSFRHAPNVDAVEFLCKQVVPLLNPALTDRHPIYIVGEQLDEKVRAYGKHLAAVRMVGWTPSVAPYLESARLTVVPLRYGAGTKRKMLKALMSGTPTVSTSIGIEGLHLRDGEEVLVADEPQKFATAITRLIEDDALWQRLARQGLAHAASAHGRAKVAEQLRQFVSDVLAAPPRIEKQTAPSGEAKPSRLSLQQYHALCADIKDIAAKALPQQAKVAVVSHGDDELLKLNGCVGCHFPQTSEGVYAGHHPKDSEDAIAQLERLRAEGVDFLLLPSTCSWWLTHYDAFKLHLDVNYSEIARDEKACVIFDLRGNTKPGNLSCVEGGVLQSFHPEPEDTRLIAFYLPQFHSMPENDKWWGEGFTEWTNVGKAKPLFPGHYQPRLPRDLGFYDLRLADSRVAQADLARSYGIHGFCYYHYWFSGKQLLERPFNEVLASNVPDFPFCLCWANEPWSRRWDGRTEDVLQPQEYSAEDDLNHIRWLLPSLSDRRAIHIDDKPVFIVYQGRDLPEPTHTIDTWRREVARAGLPGIYLMTVETGWDSGWDATAVGFDAKILFAPQFTTLFNSGARIPVPGKDNLRVFDYQKAWPVLANPTPAAYPRYETVCPGWDNTARRGEQAVVLHNSSSESYQQWLAQALGRAKALPQKNRVVFINAWNEWAEGAHLEPDLQNGRAYLEATRRALIEARAASSSASPNHRAIQEARNGNGVKIHTLGPEESAPEAPNADQREKLLGDLVARTRSGNTSLHELLGTLRDEEWFWINTEGCRRSKELRDILPSAPDSDTQARIIGNSGDIALREGFHAYLLFKELFVNHSDVPLRNSRILDFGCGWGRIIRFFLKDVPPAQLTGIDCSAQLIETCKTTNRWCEFAVNPVAPPSTLPSETYDLIYLYSVFSHLSEDSQRAWLAEFHRLLRPGGLLIATTWHRGFITWCQSLREDPSIPCEPGWRRALADVFGETEKQLARYDAGQFVFAPYDRQAYPWAYSGEVPRYGEACVSHSYVLKHWTHEFEFVKFLEDRAKCPQNVIAVRKPKTRPVPF